MLEVVLQVDCEHLAAADPLGMSGTVQRDKALQYTSLIGEYASHAIHENATQFDHHSIMADDISASEIYTSKSLTSISFTNGQIERIILRYDEKKASLISRIQRLYGIFTSLATGNYATTKIPENARLQDIFTSHHSQLFVFETPENDTYIRLRKDADKGVKWG